MCPSNLFPGSVLNALDFYMYEIDRGGGHLMIFCIYMLRFAAQTITLKMDNYLYKIYLKGTKLISTLKRDNTL